MISAPSAFIAHQDLDLDQRPIAGEDYWKGQIKGIYKYKGEKYVVVAWFYTKQHLIDVRLKCVQTVLLFISQSLTMYFSLNEMQKLRLGRAELVSSNHEDVVQASCIEGTGCCYSRHDL